LVVAPPGQRGTFERTLVSDTRLSFLTIDQNDAVRRVGVKAAPPGAGAEQLYLHLAVRRPPREQFARREDRRSYVLWQLRRAVLAVGALGLAGCALYAGASWLDVVGAHAEADRVQVETRAAQDEYQRITSAFPVTQTTTDNLRATVVEFTNIARQTAAPERTLVYLSRVLEDFPLIEIDALQWRVEAPGGRSARAAATGAARAGPAATAAARAPNEILEISGRVGTTRRSDYRAITAEVQRFADALRADPAYQVQRTQLPFDVTSEGTLSGDIGTATDTGEAPRFTIVLARSIR
jgi:hypothetical protein